MSRQNGTDEHADLEAELRRDRPRPRSTFLSAMGARIEDAGGHVGAARDVARRSRPRFRYGLGVGFATVFLVVFASFGGLGYANSSVHTLRHSTPKLFSSIFHGNSYDKQGGKNDGHDGSHGGDDNGGGGGSAEHQYPHFVLVCLRVYRHHDIKIIVPQNAANKLISKGLAHTPPCH